MRWLRFENDLHLHSDLTYQKRAMDAIKDICSLCINAGMMNPPKDRYSTKSNPIWEQWITASECFVSTWNLGSSPILAHILESFAREILENQESQPLESGTQLKESGIQVPLIKDRESSTWNYRIQRLESRM